MAVIAASSCVSPLFVPGDRPDRFEKAAASGADAVIIDLEDAVAADKKAEARAHVAALRKLAVPVLVRVNAPASEWHNEDLRALKNAPIDGVVIPKTQNASEAAAASLALDERGLVVALIESALGLAQARDIALARGVKRLAFGSLDFAVDLGCAHTREALLPARMELVLASRLGGLNGPIDGVTTSIEDTRIAEDDAVYAASLGFAGKLSIHPKQIASVKKGFTPTDDEIAWARKISAASEDGAVRVGGAMADAPVRIRAEQILRRAGL